MKQEICQFISTNLLAIADEIEVLPEDELLAVGMLDSLQLMRLVQHIETRYELRVPPSDLVLENFQTVNAIARYLGERLAP